MNSDGTNDVPNFIFSFFSSNFASSGAHISSIPIIRTGLSLFLYLCIFVVPNFNSIWTNQIVWWKKQFYYFIANEDNVMYLLKPGTKLNAKWNETEEKGKKQFEVERIVLGFLSIQFRSRTRSRSIFLFPFRIHFWLPLFILCIMLRSWVKINVFYVWCTTEERKVKPEKRNTGK